MNTPSDNTPNPYKTPDNTPDNTENTDRSHAANPYRAPEAALIDETLEQKTGTGNLRSEPAQLPAGAGMQWVTDAWNLFKNAPGVWIGMTIVFFIILVVLSALPFVNMVVSLIAPVFMAGFMIAAHEQEKGSGAEFSHLFAGFQNHTGQLFLVGLLYIAGCVVVMIPGLAVMMLAGGMPLMMAMAESSPDLAAGSAILGVLLGVLIIMALIIPVMMAYWFAPALVVLNGMDAISAMKLSFKACWKNIIPFLVYGLIGLALAIPIVITLGLAYIVIGPMFIISYYTSYRSVLVQE